MTVVCGRAGGMSKVRSVPLFIASTFRDFDQERDALKREVAAYLNQQLQHYDACVAPVDLRWGVAHDEVDENRRSRQAMQVCLERIRVPGTVFVGLIGDRLGWVPPRDLADAFLHDWGLPPEWNSRSITGLECLHAAEVLGKTGNGAVVYLMRDIVGEPPPGFHDDSPATAELRTELLHLPHVSTIEYQQNYESPADKPDLAQFIAAATEALLPLVLAQLPQAKPAPASAYARSELYAWERHAATYLARQTDDAVSQNVGERQVLIVGPSGSGRTSTALEAVHRLRAADRPVVHYVAEWNMVVDHADTLCYLLATGDTEANALTSGLRTALLMGTTVVVDGVELLDDETWNSVLAVAPGASGLVLTVTDDSPRAEVLNQLLVSDSIAPSAEIHLQPFSAAETLSFLQLRGRSRHQQLPESAGAALAEEGRWPGWLDLIVGQLDQLGSADYEGLDGRQGALEARLEQLVRELTDLDRIVDRIHQRCSAAMGEASATAVLSSLALAYDGLTWDELRNGFGLSDLDIALLALLAAGAVVERRSDRTFRMSSLSLRSLVSQPATPDEIAAVHLRLAEVLVSDASRAPACLWHALRSANPVIATEAFTRLANFSLSGGEVDRAARAVFATWFSETAAASELPAAPAALLPLDPVSFSRLVAWVRASSRLLPSVPRLRLARETEALAPRGALAATVVASEASLDLARLIAHLERTVGERPISKTALPKSWTKLIRQEEP